MSSPDEMSSDGVTTLIALRRALAPLSQQHARFGTTPADGLTLDVPHDPDWRIEVRPRGQEWAVVEIQVLPPPLPQHERVLGRASLPDVPALVDREFGRLVMERRNAACGTPSRRIQG